MTNVYKVTLLIVDHDNIGADEIKHHIENTKYPNWCMSPRVMASESRPVEWEDSHPLNFRDSQQPEFERMFAK